MSPARLDLGAVARDAVSRVPGAASRTSLRLPADRELFVKGDAERLEQVMTNLLSNAVKYSAADTEIVLELSQRDGHAEVASGRRSSALLPQIPDAPIVPGDDIGRSIRRPVVDREDLARRMGLIEDALQSLREMALAVEDGDDAADREGAHGATLASNASRQPGTSSRTAPSSSS